MYLHNVLKIVYPEKGLQQTVLYSQDVQGKTANGMITNAQG